MEYPHRPVLLREVLGQLVTRLEGIYVDGTVGSGGHSEAIGKKIRPKGRLICLDRDRDAVRISTDRLSPLGAGVTVLKGNYVDLVQVLLGLGIGEVDGILLDLGLSSYQLDRSGRGFSFNRDEPLDMRMDPDEDLTAQQLINTLSPEALEKMLRDYGEEKRARIIAKSILRERKIRPIDSSLQLANLIRSLRPVSHLPKAKHPATRTFQALRIAVNRELENLRAFLDTVPSLIAQGGRLVIISYHSLEDRLVKEAMKRWEKGCICPPELPKCTCDKLPIFSRLHKKGIKPSQSEIKMNPRARSATLRAAERI